MRNIYSLHSIIPFQIKFVSLDNFKLSVVSVFAFATLWLMLLSVITTAAQSALPALRGAEAIERLKQNGQYNSLAATFRVAQNQEQRQGQIASPNFWEKGKTSETAFSPMGLADFVQQARVTAGDAGAIDYFGYSVALSADTVIIGASQKNVGTNDQQGAAYIFVRNGITWTQQAKLTANDAALGDKFGISVALSGDTAIVGADEKNIAGNSGQGAVYVFTRSGTTWTQQARLLANDGAALDYFGHSVSLSGETVIVGAYQKNVGANENQGAAYVFTRSGTTWAQQAKLNANDAEAGDGFGYSVALSSDTAIVGAYRKDIGGNGDQGAAYVFVRVGTMWTQQTRLLANDGIVFDYFGHSVALSGDTAIVGADEKTVGQNSHQGAAYVFVRSGTTWTQQTKLTASDGTELDYFGYGIALSGNTAIIGAFGKTIGAILYQGAAYVFTRSGTTWTQTRFIANDGAASDNFGFSVALSGNTAVVGASQKTVGTNSLQGAAYIFTNNAVSTIRTQFDYDADGKADVSVFRPSSGSWYISRSSNGGFSATQFGMNGDLIAPADFDGDGKTDFCVFRPSNGTWYRLNSSNNAFNATQFGVSSDLPVAGDFDADGRADIAVFRPGNGIWYRLNSSNNQFVSTQFGVNGDKPQVGDFDGDGKADIAVFRPSSGVWYVLRSTNGSFFSTQFGMSGDVATTADYDGDGKADISVFRPSNGVWYRLNSSNNQFVTAQFGINGDVPAAADYDGDGRADIAVFRPSNGIWYLLRSTQGFTALQFGASGDVPTPSAFGE